VVPAQGASPPTGGQQAEGDGQQNPARGHLVLEPVRRLVLNPHVDLVEHPQLVTSMSLSYRPSRCPQHVTGRAW
jgi:hypothetical protein